LHATAPGVAATAVATAIPTTTTATTTALVLSATIGDGDRRPRKVFVGGIAWETTEDGLKLHLEHHGSVRRAIVISDHISSRSKGSGFLTFWDPKVAQSALADPNPLIEGRCPGYRTATPLHPRDAPLSVPRSPGVEELYETRKQTQSSPDDGGRRKGLNQRGRSEVIWRIEREERQGVRLR
jgi:RNA recognition motif-containing protein